MASDAVEQTINVLATIATVFIFLSMIPEHVRIVKSKSTQGVAFFPLVAMFVQSLFWVLYGWASHAFWPLSTVNLLGVVMAVVYWCCFLPFEKEYNKRYYGYIIVSILFMIAMIIYTIVSPQDRDYRSKVVGYMANVAAIIMFASPFLAMKEVITSKHSDLISPGMALTGMINGALWSAYGFMQSDDFVVVPNFINACLCLIQLILIAIYPRSKAKKGAELGLDDDKYDNLPENAA